MNKWVFNRVGLVNFWYYPMQEFYFAKGHLLLRGSNGSGKSLTMQSLLPVLLDGNTQARRLDSFGSRARRMEDYLLGEEAVSGKDEGTGYLYMELKNPERQEYITCGMGLQYRRGGTMQKWFFSLPSNYRIGQNFELYTKIRDEEIEPLSKRKLINALEGKGRFFDKATDYKAYVNTYVFGFADEERMDELIELLINLRSPKLSRDFKPTVIYDILRNSLPPLKDDELLPLAQTIEQIDAKREQEEQLGIDIARVRQVAKLYEEYTKERRGQIAGKWREEMREAAEREGKWQAAKKRKDELDTEIAEQEQMKIKIDSHIEVIDTQLTDLQNADEFTLVREGERLRKQKVQIQEELARENQQLVVKQKAMDLQQKRQDDYRLQEQRLQEEFEEYVSEASACVSVPELSSIHDLLLPAMKEGLQPEQWKHWIKVIKNEMTYFKAMLEKFKVLSQHTAEYREANRVLGESIQRLDELQRDRSHWQSILQDETERWKDSLYTWYKESNMVLEQGAYEASIAAINDLLVDEIAAERVLAPIRQAYLTYCQTIHQGIARIEAEVVEIETKQASLRAEIGHWQSLRFPEPPRSEGRERYRKILKAENTVYIPLYEAVDFKDCVDETTRNRLESALLTSGLLDALVTVDSVRVSDNILITPQPQMMRSTLADYMQVEEDVSECLRHVVADTLQTILVNEGDERLPSITTTGDFSLAGVVGRGDDEHEASFIGRFSRERYKKQQILALEKELVNYDAERAELIRKREQEEAKLGQAEKHMQELPVGDEVYEAFDERRKLEIDINYISERKKQQEENVHKLHQIVLEKKTELAEKHTKANKHTLPCTEEGYRKAEPYVQEYYEAMRDAYTIHGQCRQVARQRRESEESYELYRDEWMMVVERKQTKELESKRCEEAIIENSKQQAIKNVQELQVKLRAYEEEKAELREQRKKIDNHIITLSKEQGTNDEQLVLHRNAYTKAQIRADAWKSLVDTIYSEQAQGSLEETDFLKEDIDILSQKLTSCQSAVQAAMDELREYNPRGTVEKAIDTHSISAKELGLWSLYNQEYTVTFMDGAGTMMPQELVERLEAQLSALTELLNREDTELFKRIVFDSIGKILRARIDNAISWIQQMDAMLQKQENSSGLSLSLRLRGLEKDTDDQLDTNELFRLLHKDPVTLSKEDTDRIQQHFRSKVDSVRATSEEDGDITLLQAMRHVLDYRYWFSFELRYKRQNKGYQWQELTDNTFFKFSGGEKAVAMYLPLFAAVHARYKESAPWAPYIITLDEAFAGIDELNIGELFKACEELGFNYIMNSQSLYGEYKTVSDLMTYELIRPQNAPIVSTVQYHWNGEQTTMRLE
ncbi:TIGR02680 family protein [Veillonella magna]|uniref:TIGR02680 family protein n=1 Tax=Veillonella magna TaxID=464322 RepID=UPI0023F19257|nr:TIGR02680 family protein [Veillonella magna]